MCFHATCEAASIVPRGDILQSNNNWTPNWAPALRIEFYPVAGSQSRFDYYTGSVVVPMTGSMSESLVSWQAGDLGSEARSKYTASIASRR